MNYQDLAQALNRPYNTVRKWRGEIEKISGHSFTRIRVRNGRGRKNRTAYDFSNEDVQDFLDFKKLLHDGKGKEQAISEIWGNLVEESLEEQENRFSRLTKNFNVAKGKISTLEEKNQTLRSEVNTLNNQMTALSQRVDALENKGIINKLKKK
jgi:polyhydroxyalkanoate synthesis regulator phasin